MRGEFYTERDIVDLVRRGQRQLRLHEGDRMTDVARERAQKEGLQLVGEWKVPEQAAREAAAVRYAQVQASTPSRETNTSNRGGVHQRVRQAVIDRLGTSVDEALLDRVIARVLDQLGLS
ncbi:MAG: hypothetical protein WBR18_00290 [Anaerolineales bacterium]